MPDVVPTRSAVDERGRNASTFTFDDLMRYHGPRSPAGVAIAFKVMARAFALLSPGDSARPAGH